MVSAIAERKLFMVRIPSWASGGLDAYADTPEEAALRAGGFFLQYSSRTEPPAASEVLRYLPGSRIGATVLESCGIHPLFHHDQYQI